MFALFLDELDSLTTSIPALRLEGHVTDNDVRRRWRNLVPGRYVVRRGDFLPQYGGTLDEATRAMYFDQTKQVAPGRVLLLANLRSLGWNFNPIAVYFFFSGDELVRAVAEVTNTPWGDRHLYLLGPAGLSTFAKAHHVSPFLEMAGTYRLHYSEPGERFALSMTLHDLVEGRPESEGPRRFSATMALERRELSRTTLRAMAWRYPDMAFRVSLRIYLQAGALFSKGLKYVAHPTTPEKDSHDVVR